MVFRAPAWRAMRRVAAALIAALARTHTPREIEARLARRPRAEQAFLVLGTLAGLLALSLLFAQAGFLGLVLFLLLVWLLIR